MDGLYRNLLLLGDGIEACLERDNVQAALVLIYAAIDTSGWLASDQLNANRSTFIHWVDRYLLPNAPFECSSVDLYAARCGMLHTFTPESKLTQSGDARLVNYAWGNGAAADIERLNAHLGVSQQYVSVHVRDLYESWRVGLGQFVSNVESSPELAQSVRAKASKFFKPVAEAAVRETLDSLGTSA